MNGTEPGDNVGGVHAVVIMGPAGSGKTTVGMALAQATGARFVDADAHHPLTNVEKMRAGVALTDADRLPWLRELAHIIKSSKTTRLVLACSALKESYRTILRDNDPGVRFFCLSVPKEELTRRLSARAGHFFNPNLLETQLLTLQSPPNDEIDGTLSVNELVTDIARQLDWPSARGRNIVT